MKTIVRISLVLAVAFSLAWAGEIDRKIGKAPVALALAQATEANPPSGPVASGDVIAPSLNAMVIVASIDEINTNGIPGVRGLVVRGPAFLKIKAFEKTVAPYLGQPFGITTLARLQTEIVLFCRKQGHPVVDVFFRRDTEIVDGVVQMAVIEGKLGTVRVVDPRKPRVPVISTNITAEGITDITTISGAHTGRVEETIR